MNRAVKITTYHRGTDTQRKKKQRRKKTEKIFSVPLWWVLPSLAQEIQLAAFGLVYCKVKSGGQECPLHTSPMGKLLRFFRPSHQHTAFSATLLMMGAVMLSRVIGYAREAYIAYAFGAGARTDAYVAAFTLPDFLNYILAGGAASITFVSIYTRFLAEKRDADAQKTFSIVITVMTTVMVVGTILAEIFAPEFVHWFVRDFKPDQIELCAHLTRILLPAQIFFYVGGVVSAVLLSHRLFLLPAFGPLIYNLFIIVGGVVGGRHYGIASLAYGALIGSIAGPFLASVVGAARIGTGYRPSFDVGNPAFREWVKLSIPLMLGVSLVTADDWILRHYASGVVGAISLLNYAKRLFSVPIAVLGQATGQASLPFFARLFNEKRMREFSATVSDSVYRISAAAFLATAWMMAAALPLIDLVYRRGRFLFSDTQTTAVYFFWFSLSLVLWSAQGLYARAFYAAGDTLTPMTAVSVITVASLPIYSFLFHTFGVLGLAWASDIGIGMNLVALAVLLHYRKLILLGEMRWGELGKALVTAAIAGVLSLEVAKIVPLSTSGSGNGSRVADLLRLGMITVTWAAAVAAGLWLMRSELPGHLRRRKVTAYPGVEGQSKEILGAGREP
jgi:putative peptidoglycan lipid II flippase